MGSDKKEGDKNDKDVLVDETKEPMNPMRNNIILAFSFLIVFSAQAGIQALQSSINQSEGLGVASLACIHGANIVSSVLAPVIIHLTGIKLMFIIAFFTQCLYTASNFLPLWSTLIPASVLTGMVLSPMWIARHLYVNSMGQHSSETNKSDLHGSLSRFNGIFFSISCFAGVVGNLISSVVLYHSDSDQSYWNKTSICGADDCPGLANHTTQIVRPDQDVLDVLLGLYLGCGLLGLAITALFLRPLKLEKDSNDQLLQKMVACCSVFQDKKLLLLIPLKLSWSVNAAIMLIGFTKAFVSCTVGVKMLGYVLMCHGIVTALSAVSFGHLAKYVGRIPLMVVPLTIDIGTIVTLLLWKPTPDHYQYLFVTSCVLATGDGVWISQIMSLITIAFPDKQPAVFSNIATWGNIGFTAVLVTDTILCLRTKLYFAIGLWVAGVIGYIAVEILLIVEKKKEGTPYENMADGASVGGGDVYPSDANFMYESS